MHCTDHVFTPVFGVHFDTIAAAATYSTAPNIPFGGGTLSPVPILQNSNTTIHFPFTINYTTTLDPGATILKDISYRCGFNSTPKVVRPITVNYTLRLTLNILSIKITPS